jgi:hypothetical protein
MNTHGTAIPHQARRIRRVPGRGNIDVLKDPNREVLFRFS